MPGQAAGGEQALAAPGLAETMARIESEIIRRALKEAGGNQAEAARRLQIPRRTLGEKIARLGILDANQP
jgi:two-component system C4-dicarboxylate transport response regulator DctD